MFRRPIIYLILIVSFLGFLDASYLTIKHYQGTPPPCSLLKGCEIVTTSSYSLIGGVPVALLGALYYLGIFLATLLYLDTRNEWLVRCLKHFTVVGLLSSIYFLYLQLFVIQAICLYCLGSAATSITLFILAVLFL